MVVLSIIIANRNGEKLISHTLRLLLKTLGCRDDIEIIVVDDNSTDKSVEVIRSLLEGSCLRYQRLIVLRRRVGPAMARNLGAVAAKGEILLFIDNDTFIYNNIIDIIIEIFKKNKNIVMLQPMIEPFMKNSTSWGGGGYITPTTYGYIDRVCRGTPFYPLGSALAIRRNVFFAVGGFTPEYEYMHEEASLAWKVRRYTNGEIICVPEAKVKHVGRKSGSQKVAILMRHNRVLLVLENHDGLDAVIFSVLVILKLLIASPNIALPVLRRLAIMLPKLLRRRASLNYRRYSNLVVFSKFSNTIRVELHEMRRLSRTAYALTLWVYKVSSLRHLLGVP